MKNRPGIRRFILQLAVLAATVPFLAGVRAPVRNAAIPAEIGRTVPKAKVVRDRIAFEADTKIARALYSPNYTAAHADAETMARRFLSDNAELLHMQEAAPADLENYFTREGLAGTTVRFHQKYRGLPVLGDDIAVTIDKSDHVIFAMNGFESKISVPSITPALAGAEARRIALDYLGADGPLAFDQTTLSILPAAGQSSLVYQVKIAPRTAPHGDWEVLVDAQTGVIVRVLDRAAYINGSGLTSDPDPLSVAGAQYGGNYVDNNDATNASLDATRTSVTLLDITDIGGGTYKLAGPYAVITDTESPFNGLFTQGSTTFNYNRFDDAFEAVLCYYQIDQTMRYINTTLGVSVMPIQYSGGVRFDPHGLSGADNSHYTSSTGEIAFGEGGVDDSEDADVVTHELGHALHDWLTGGNLSQVDGLSEGTGDYIAQSYSRSLGQWAPSDPEYNWVYSWDGHNPFWAGRITNYSATYPGGLVGQVHTDGQIWSTSLMGIYDQIGRQQIDRAVYEGLAMTNASSSQNDAAQAVLNAASALGYPSSDITAIYNGFTATGYTVTAPVASLVAGSPLFTSAGANNAADPGETVSFTIDITNIGSVGVTAVSAVLSSSTPGVIVDQGSSAYPDLGAGASGTNATDYTITIPASHVCGDPVDLSLLISYDDGAPNSTTQPSTMGTGVVVGVSQSVSPGLAIPDNDPVGITSKMTVSGTGATVTANLNVDLNITHTWIGDLIVTLQSPAGTQVILHNQTGSSANDIIGNYPGTLTPAQSLSAMIGDPIDGVWTMIVSDNAGADTGTLNSWGINDVSGYTCDSIATGIAAAGSFPLRFALGAARPNPFRPSTTIRFAIPGNGSDVALDVFDVTGRHVKTLASGFRSSGEYAVTWDGANDSGRKVSAGVYFYRLKSDGFVKTRKVTFLK